MSSRTENTTGGAFHTVKPNCGISKIILSKLCSVNLIYVSMDTRSAASAITLFYEQMAITRSHITTVRSRNSIALSGTKLLMKISLTDVYRDNTNRKWRGGYLEVLI
jgi:hypothetical protein